MSEFISFGEVLIDFISRDYVRGLKNASTFDKYLGGSPSNIAVNIAKQGFNSTIISRVGNDPFGDFILEKLSSYGINTHYIIQDDMYQTDIVYVLKSQTSPEFYPFRSASLNLEIPKDFNNILNGLKIFHLSSWAISSDKNLKNSLQMIKEAKKKGAYIGFDPNYRKILWKTSIDIDDVLRLILPYVDFLKPSLDDCINIFQKDKREEEYIDIFHNLGVKNVILTLGEKGFIVSDGSQKVNFNSYAKEVKDTTGAGDAFWSGFYIGILTGLDIIESSKLGNAFSAEKLKYVGAIADIEDYKKILKKYEIKKL